MTFSFYDFRHLGMAKLHRDLDVQISATLSGSAESLASATLFVSATPTSSLRPNWKETLTCSSLS